MITELGIISGEILIFFGKINGPLCAREMELHLKVSKDVILMSLGWLIREGLINAECINGEYFFKLKEGKEGSSATWRYTYPK